MPSTLPVQKCLYEEPRPILFLSVPFYFVLFHFVFFFVFVLHVTGTLSLIPGYITFSYMLKFLTGNK